MNPEEAAALLDLIVDRAPALRAAGIRKVNLGSAAFELDPDGGGDVAPPENDDGGIQSIAELLAAGTPGDLKKERPPL